jgi:hypothetical protein
MLRHLRSVASIASLCACAFFVVMWMRSQQWQDTLYYVPSHGSRIYRIDTYVGRAYVGVGAWIPAFAEPALSLSSDLHASEPATIPIHAGFFGLKWSSSAAYTGAYLPYWLLTLLSGAIFASLNVSQLTRFGLKRLLIATALAACVLGLGAAATTSTTAFHWRLL